MREWIKKVFSIRSGKNHKFVMTQTSSFPLGMAAEGGSVRITALRGGVGLARRVIEMGLNVGSEINIY